MKAQPEYQLQPNEYRFDIETKSEANQREHWRKRHSRTKAQREAFHWMWLKAKPSVTLPAVITFIRHAPRRLDSDNLAMAFKRVRDQLAEEIGVDDGNASVQWRYEQQFASKVNYFVVRIESRSSTGI